MTVAESIPLVGRLIAWYKTWRDEKRAEPLVTPFVKIKPDPKGTIDLWLVIRSDSAILNPRGSYEVYASAPIPGKERTEFGRDAIYPNEPLEERILYIKAPPATAIRDAEAEVVVSISLKYKQKTGETSTATGNAN